MGIPKSKEVERHEVSATKADAQKTVQFADKEDPSCQNLTATITNSYTQEFKAKEDPYATGNAKDAVTEIKTMFYGYVAEGKEVTAKVVEPLIQDKIKDKERASQVTEDWLKWANTLAVAVNWEAPKKKNKELYANSTTNMTEEQIENNVVNGNPVAAFVWGYAAKKGITEAEANEELEKDKDFKEYERLRKEGKHDEAEKLEAELRKKYELSTDMDVIQQKQADVFEWSGSTLLEAGVSSSVIENAGKRLIEMGNSYVAPVLTSLTGYFEDAVVGKAALFLTQKNFEAMQKELNEERERIRKYLEKLLGKAGAKEIDAWAKKDTALKAKELTDSKSKAGAELNELIDKVVANEKNRIVAELKEDLASVPMTVKTKMLGVIPRKSV